MINWWTFGLWFAKFWDKPMLKQKDWFDQRSLRFNSWAVAIHPNVGCIWSEKPKHCSKPLISHWYARYFTMYFPIYIYIIFPHIYLGFPHTIPRMYHWSVGTFLLPCQLGQTRTFAMRQDKACERPLGGKRCKQEGNRIVTTLGVISHILYYRYYKYKNHISYTIDITYH